jgi:hypothetical protein
MLSRGHATLVSLLTLALFYYWFVVADRYAVFLYDHLGATPYDALTLSRYWMCGLVADGIVLVVYTGGNGLLGRILAKRGRRYDVPAWWWVWLLSAPVLSAGISGITMTVNQPTLPLASALACTATTLAGLAVSPQSGQPRYRHSGRCCSNQCKHCLAWDNDYATRPVARPLAHIHRTAASGAYMELSWAATYALSVLHTSPIPLYQCSVQLFCL